MRTVTVISRNGQTRKVDFEIVQVVDDAQKSPYTKNT